MGSNKSFHRPAAAAVAVAVAAGAALLPIAGVSSAAPPAATLQVGHTTTTKATSTALTNLGGTRSPGIPVGGGLVSGNGGVSPTPPKLPDGPLGIPSVMLDAYQRAQQTMADTQPGCHLFWTVLAGIGKIESGHARDGRVDAAGNTLGPILGPRLDGSPGMAAISDTDQGALDGDSGWDRAVGPMQFIPSSWRAYGVGNPNNIYDSTLAAGRYLCAGAPTSPTRPNSKRPSSGTTTPTAT